MKKISFLTLCLAIFAISQSAIAQDYQIPADMPINNGELEWLSLKDNIAEVKVRKNKVAVKSKCKSTSWGIKLVKPAMTFSKVPLQMNGDFYLSATVKPTKIDNETMFGIVVNAPNEADYNVIAFDKQFCYFLRVMNLNGAFVIQGEHERVRYKYNKKKGNVWTIALERRNGGDYSVMLNGLEVRTLPKVLQFNFPAIGLFVTNRAIIDGTGVAYEQWAAPIDSEE